MFAHHSCVFPYYVFISEQVEDIEHYNASIGGEFDVTIVFPDTRNEEYLPIFHGSSPIRLP